MLEIYVLGGGRVVRTTSNERQYCSAGLYPALHGRGRPCHALLPFLELDRFVSRFDSK
jgi:hypothetical protein